MEGLPALLSGFDPISLREMDEVALLDRTDTKYTFSESNLRFFLEKIRKDYFVLEVNGNRSTTYETLYFDTPGYEFYLRHHKEKLNRYKARFRRYVESDLVFFEVKFKSNKGRTIKRRIKTDKIRFPLPAAEANLFREATGLDPLDYKPVLWVNYTRTTFVSKALDERLTVDTDLVFIDATQPENPVTLPLTGLVIAEVKQKKISFGSPFVRLMHTTHMRRLSISKYCIGIARLHPELKANNFKSKILTINKITHGTHHPRHGPPTIRQAI